MDEGLQTMIFMGLILKIPIGMMIYIIYWAWKSQPDVAEAPEEEGGDHRHRRFRREPKRPRDPRRGPHAPGGVSLPCPEDEREARPARGPAAPGRSPIPATGRDRRQIDRV